MGEERFLYMSDVAHASAAEYRVAALALVFHATSTLADDALIELVTLIADGTSTYSSDTTWKPSLEWSTTQRPGHCRLDEGLARAGHAQRQPRTISPVIYVAESPFHIFTTTNTVQNWRRRLCATLDS